MGLAGPSTHPSGIQEIPIVVDDWDILIKQNKGVVGLNIEMKKNVADQACFLLHPWRVGQKKYVGALQKLLSSTKNFSFPRMAQGKHKAASVYLGGDIGEFGLLEIAQRILCGILK